MQRSRILIALALGAALALACAGCSGGKFVASKASSKYHDPSCVWAKSIDWDRRVWFDSAAEAEKAGYVPCGECLSSD